MSMLALALVALLVLLGCTWFFFGKAVNMFTSDAPAEITVATPTAPEFEAAEAKMNQLRAAVRSNQSTTVSFSATDLNALIARDADLASRKGRTRVSIADSRATFELSVPLEKASLPRLKHRWFNGNVRLGFSYDDTDGFSFDPDWIEANGHHLTGGFLRAIASGFSRSFTTSFEDSLDKNSGGAFWKQVKSITLEGDQLIVTTRGPTGTTI